jgi:hypothetical protein
VFENKALTRIFRPRKGRLKRREGGEKLHNEELRVLYFSPRIIRIIKSRRMRWAVHVAQMGKEERV